MKPDATEQQLASLAAEAMTLAEQTLAMLMEYQECQRLKREDARKAK